MVSKNPVAITVTQPVVVTVAGQSGRPYSGLAVYAFDGDTYTGFKGVTDAHGRGLTFTERWVGYEYRGHRNRNENANYDCDINAELFADADRNTISSFFVRDEDDTGCIINTVRP